MARKAGNFIKTFSEHYSNGFVPPKFYIWSAISLIGAALERRVWLPWFGGNVYPNMYIFLVAGPGEGKSSAIRPATKLLKMLNKSGYTQIRLLPNQTTEAKLLDILGEPHYFTYKNKQYEHSSAFLIASEASACFKNSEEHGIVKSLTALYDKDDFHKETVSRPEPVHIKNPCVNILAGSTFHDLNTFLNKQGILGGFASRCTYVVHKKSLERKSVWFDESKHKQNDDKINGDLVHDLGIIAKITGGFTATPEVQEAWNQWWPEFDKRRRETQSEVMKAFIVRKMTALQKLVQILCVADGDDMVIKLPHWNWAIKLVDEVEKDIPDMLREGQATAFGTASGVKAAVITALKEKPGEYTRASLLATLALHGHDGTQLGVVINALVNDPGTVATREGRLTLLANPDLHL